MKKPPASILLDRDKLIMADRNAVAALCVHIFDTLSRFPRKEEQVVALAAAFLLLCKAAGVRPPEVYEAANNLIYDPLHSERMKAQFAGMSFYLKDEGFV